MKTDSTALPWFPLTPDYVDRYSDGVLKYVRDNLDRDNSADTSWGTTVRLILERAGIIMSERLSDSLLETKSKGRQAMMLEAKIVAAAIILKKNQGDTDIADYIVLLSFLLCVAAPDSCESLSGLAVRCLKSSAVDSINYTMDDVIAMDTTDFVKKLLTTSMTSTSSTRWFLGNGTVKATADGFKLYALAKYMLEFSSSSSVKEVVSGADGFIGIMYNRRTSKDFRLEDFILNCNAVEQRDTDHMVLKDYQDGDSLTVKVTHCTYDTMFATSTDPAYNPLNKEVRILSASNVRGLYMTDFVRNMPVGTTINVIYDEDNDCFNIEKTVIDFIHDKYWFGDAENQVYYETTDAILLFCANDKIMNTWLTREGFLVRSGYEQFPRYTFKALKIVDYDEDYDFLLAEVSDDEPSGERFKEAEARDNFIHFLVYSNKTISTPMPKKPEIKFVPANQLTLFHRILAEYQNVDTHGSTAKLANLTACCALSAITGDAKDLDYYIYCRAYLKAITAFAAKKFGNIKQLNDDFADTIDGLTMKTMVSILSVYGCAEESEVLSNAILTMGDSPLASVAKLIQASNRFLGTPSLEKLRSDLHREICVILGVSDAIAQDEVDTDRFPFKPEGEDTEHKMSWIFDNENGELNETSQSAKIMKTICAFMNRYREQGESHIYIGTDEKRRCINGIQADIDALISKGRLSGSGDNTDEYLRLIIQKKIRERFPDAYQNVHPVVCCEGRVIDILVEPASEGVIYLNGIAYYRYGSESKVMTPTIEEEVRNRKYIQRSGMSERIEAARRAINTEHTAIIKSYDSSHSNSTDFDRKVEIFAFTDNSRLDAVWAFDPKDSKNKVFSLKRCEGIEVLDEKWKRKAQHEVYELDIFGFSGKDKIDIDITLNTVRAKNILVEQYPDSAICLDKVGSTRWRLRTTLFNTLSLEAACSFYLANSDDVDISASPVLKSTVTVRVEKILANI